VVKDQGKKADVRNVVEISRRWRAMARDRTDARALVRQV